MTGEAGRKSQQRADGPDKVSGIRKFQPAEDINVTKAYKKVSLDASIGTDQDGSV